MPKSAVTRINGAFQVQSTYVGDPSNPNDINGFALPQLTTIQAQTKVAALNPAVLQNGFIYYDTTLNQVVTYANLAWTTLIVAGYKLVNANYTVLNTDVIIGVDTTGARAITLPAANTVTIGKIFTIKDVTGGAGANNITVTATIDGVANIVIAADYGFANVLSNGTAWFSAGKLIA